MIIRTRKKPHKAKWKRQYERRSPVWDARCPHCAGARLPRGSLAVCAVWRDRPAERVDYSPAMPNVFTLTHLCATELAKP